MTDAAGRRSIAFDDRGKTRPGGVTAAAEYDGHGRLTRYERTGGGAGDFVYNGLDDRVMRRSIPPASAASSTTPTAA